MENPVRGPTNVAVPTGLSDSAITKKGNTDFTINKRGSSSTTSKTKAANSFLLGRQSAIENFHKKLKKLSQTPGKHLQDRDMSMYSNDGNVIHFRVMRIPILLV